MEVDAVFTDIFTVDEAVVDVAAPAVDVATGTSSVLKAHLEGNVEKTSGCVDKFPGKVCNCNVFPWPDGLLKKVKLYGMAML